MKILVVGAGAVGTVYGRHFQLGGAEVSFLVRPKYAEACRKGFRFYLKNRSQAERDQFVEMKNFGVLTEMDEVAASQWDHIVLAMSSTALHGNWLDELIRASGKAALVTLQPGIDDREYILAKAGMDSNRLIEGMIPIIGYIAPLPGEMLPSPGIAYWLPPGATGPFSGPAEIVRPLVGLLRKGGFPARVSKDARQESLFPSTILTILIAALEACHWSLQRLGKGPELNVACKAIPEAFKIVGYHRGVQPPIFKSIFKPGLFKGVIYLSRWIVPFDLETYLKVHFTKVQDQMHEALQDYLSIAAQASISAPALSELQRLRSKGAKIK